MNLDIRIPIGLMFGIIGLLLAIFGLMSDSQIYNRSLGVNINLWWGIIIFVIAVALLCFSWWRARLVKKKNDYIQNQKTNEYVCKE